MWQEKLRIKKDNSIAGLYPFAKLWIVLLYSICVSILGTMKIDGYPVYMMCSFLVIPILAAFTGIIKKFWNVINKMIVICILIVVVQSLLVQDEIILWTINVFDLFNLNVYKGSLQYAFVLSFSILCFGGILIWFFGSTENKELIRACEKKGMGPKASYVLLSTLQMIEVLQKSSKTIMSAQQARGVETEGNIFVRAKAFLPSMIPLILGAVTNTEERVLTLESKGFSVKGVKTRIYEVYPNGKEKLAMTIAISFTALVLVWRVMLWVM